MDGATDAGATNASRLYVGNIPWSTTVEDLRDLFADCGGVRDVDIPTGRQGRSRGYGIVEFATEADALAAQGRYGEAVRLLLARGAFIDDVFPGAVR